MVLFAYYADASHILSTLCTFERDSFRRPNIAGSSCKILYGKDQYAVGKWLSSLQASAGWDLITLTS